ncbi:MAG: TIGR03086 family metal-binding protein [Pseudonocardiaceae bacterium]
MPKYQFGCCHDAIRVPGKTFVQNTTTRGAICCGLAPVACFVVWYISTVHFSGLSVVAQFFRETDRRQSRRAVDDSAIHFSGVVNNPQWSAPTPCTDWTVRQLVNHQVGMNWVFVALLGDQTPPRPGADRLGNDPERAYHDSAVALEAAFAQPGVLERTYHGPLGAATGTERPQIRLYDLLAHGWDLAQTPALRPVAGPCRTPVPSRVARQLDTPGEGFRVRPPWWVLCVGPSRPASRLYTAPGEIHISGP